MVSATFEWTTDLSTVDSNSSLSSWEGIDGLVHHFLTSVVICRVCQTLSVLCSSPNCGPKLECRYVGGEVLEHFHGTIVKVHQCSCVLLLIFSPPLRLCRADLLSSPADTLTHTCSSSMPIYTPTCTALKEQLIHPLRDTHNCFCCVQGSQCLQSCPAWGSPVC